MTPKIDPAKVAKYVIKLSGGRDAVFDKNESDFKHLMSVWEQDFGSIGRILRAHLFVENFLNEQLTVNNPNLGSLTKARLTFHQKVSLLETSPAGLEDIMPGIRRLNTVRNRLAHSLHANLSTEDAEVFLSCPYFKALREACNKGASNEKKSEVIDIIEDFALHVGSRVQAHVSGASIIWAEAMRLAEEETEVSK